MWKLQLVLLTITITLSQLSSTAYAADEVFFNRVVDAIYIIEGSERAVKPFGILSVPCSSYSECRRICLNTVRNNYRRWEKSDKVLTYFEFLASRYAPIGAENDPNNLNRHWLKNLEQVINKLSTGYQQGD